MQCNRKGECGCSIQQERMFGMSTRRCRWVVAGAVSRSANTETPTRGPLVGTCGSDPRAHRSELGCWLAGLARAADQLVEPVDELIRDVGRVAQRQSKGS